MKPLNDLNSKRGNMDTRDLWEEHINGLTKQVAYLLHKVKEMEERAQYFEEVVITLITALKNAGVIVDDESGDNQMPS
jgi:uncharacterized protein YoxC